MAHFGPSKAPPPPTVPPMGPQIHQGGMPPMPQAPHAPLPGYHSHRAPPPIVIIEKKPRYAGCTFTLSDIGNGKKRSWKSAKQTPWTKTQEEMKQLAKKKVVGNIDVTNHSDLETLPLEAQARIERWIDEKYDADTGPDVYQWTVALIRERNKNGGLFGTSSKSIDVILKRTLSPEYREPEYSPQRSRSDRMANGSPPGLRPASQPNFGMPGPMPGTMPGGRGPAQPHPGQFGSNRRSADFDDGFDMFDPNPRPRPQTGPQGPLPPGMAMPPSGMGGMGGMGKQQQQQQQPNIIYAQPQQKGMHPHPPPPPPMGMPGGHMFMNGMPPQGQFPMPMPGHGPRPKTPKTPHDPHVINRSPDRRHPDFVDLSSSDEEGTIFSLDDTSSVGTRLTAASLGDDKWQKKSPTQSHRGAGSKVYRVHNRRGSHARYPSRDEGDYVLVDKPRRHRGGNNRHSYGDKMPRRRGSVGDLVLKSEHSDEMDRLGRRIDDLTEELRDLHLQGQTRRIDEMRREKERRLEELEQQRRLQQIRDSEHRRRLLDIDAARYVRDDDILFTGAGRDYRDAMSRRRRDLDDLDAYRPRRRDMYEI